MKNICILGSTGSIGRSSLEVISNFPEQFRVICLSANKNIDLLLQQIKQFAPKQVAVQNRLAAEQLKSITNGKIDILVGNEGLLGLVTHEGVDIVISSLVGFAGLCPTIEAVKMGKKVALATKEVLVVAGEIVMQLVKENNVTLIPIDSEHSAIMQCLTGEDKNNVERLILTASGGPFLNLNQKQLETVTVDEALKHPNWKMGNKITIDSATLMNKGLEIIEARWLFELPPDKIEILIHPQSIIHSMVEFVDGSIKAQLGVPDMKIPIQYALTYPDRAPSNYSRVNFHKLKEMTFFEPDKEKFKCLQLAYFALQSGGTAPTILNAANEIAVEAFLQGKVKFTDIPNIIDSALEKLPVENTLCLENVIEVDNQTRQYVSEQINERSK